MINFDNVTEKKTLKNIMQKGLKFSIIHIEY